MQTLLEVLAEIRRLGDREASRFYNGFRTWKLTYTDLYRQIASFAAYLDRAGLQRGDRAILWAENRPEGGVIFRFTLSAAGLPPPPKHGERLIE